MNAAAIETRAPYMIRVRMSRPMSSVPSQWAALGPALISGKFWVGEYGARTGAKIATTITRPTNASAATATLFDQNRDQNRRVLLTSSSSGATYSPIGTGSPPSGGGIAVMDARSRELHLGVEVGVADVDDEVDEHEDHGGHENDTLDDGQVLRADGLEHVAP